MDGAESTATAPKRSSSKVLLAVLVFVLALAAFGAAFYFAGGLELVQPLIQGLTSATISPSAPAAAPGASPSATASPAATGSASPDPELGKRMYVEQIESQANLERLAAGEITKIAVGKVDLQGGTAIVSITAFFDDKTKAAGALRLGKIGPSWFLFSMSGMRDDATGGMADSVNKSTTLEASETLAVEFQQAGITAADGDVVKALFEQQSANQEIVKDLLAGEYTAYELGKPKVGAGTVSVPVKIATKSGASVNGAIVLIRKTVEGKDRIFLTKFSKQ